MIIAYAHCTFATPGQLDREPFTRYELATIDVTLTFLKADGFTPDWYHVTLGGVVIGDGESCEDALGEARYGLMCRSRDRAYREAQQAA